MALLLQESWIHLISIIMISVYNVEIDNKAIINNLNRLCNQTYRLLPMREEEDDWIKPLETSLVEIVGLNDLLGQIPDFVTLISKMQGMYKLKNDMDFMLFRRTIFECCGLITKLKESFS